MKTLRISKDLPGEPWNASGAAAAVRPLASQPAKPPVVGEARTDEYSRMLDVWREARALAAAFESHEQVDLIAHARRVHDAYRGRPDDNQEPR